jgi:hypothetical protein
MSKALKLLLEGAAFEDVARERFEVIDFYAGRIYDLSTHVIDALRARCIARSRSVSILLTLFKQGLRGALVAKLAFLNDFADYPVSMFLSPLVSLEGSKEVVRSVEESVTRAVEEVEEIDYAAAAASPLAWLTLFSLGSMIQTVTAIDGLAGVGKTTLVYNSMKAVLYSMGLSPREAEELFLASYVQMKEDLMELLRIACERGRRIPVIVYDDAAVTLSSYAWFSGEERKYLMKLARLLTISRERVSNLILVGPYTGIFRGVRMKAHVVFEPEVFYSVVPGGRRRIVTLWKVKRGDRVSDLTGTVTPHPMKVDDRVYSMITAVKTRLLARLVEEGEGREEKDKHKED